MSKTVLITGGARGLGASIAEEFAKHDYNVIVTYLSSKSDAEILCKHIQDIYKVNANCIHLDLTDEVEIKHILGNIERLDCLVNNAAYNNDCDVFEHTRDEFMKVLKVNVVGAFLMSNSAFPLLKSSGGTIVNIASTNGIDSMYPESLDYDASKAALINMTKNLSTAYAPSVRVNAIAPGWIKTHNTIDMESKFKEKELSKIALGRFAEPSEIAKLVYFVGSDDASYMTGSVIRIDGGRK